MRNLRRSGSQVCMGVFVLVAITAGSSGAAGPAASDHQPAAAWQRSWDAYVEAYNACLKDSACKPEVRFGKKRVQWEATLVALNLDTDSPSAKLSVSSAKGFNVSKPPTVFQIIWPELRASAIARWQAIPLGTVVRFDAMIEEGGGILAAFGMVGARFQDAYPLAKPN